MYKINENQDTGQFELENMPHFDMAIKRVYAWFENQIIDRPPVRFIAHNAFLDSAKQDIAGLSKLEKKAWWFDAEQQIDLFIQSIEGQRFHAETFPVYFPNLGPDVYAAFYGAELEFGEVTSWSIPLVQEWEQINQLKLDMNNPYFKKLEELTHHAIERCGTKFMVGYTDFHPGLDCMAAWRDPAQLCLDMIDNPDKINHLADISIRDFDKIYDHFDRMLKDAGQLSVSWMGIPTFGRMHIASCDFATNISPKLYNEFGLPILKREVKTMSHTIFHVDGKGVARHLDVILSVPGVHAIQWVQGVGDDYPILQWMPFIKALQAKGIPVVVDLRPNDLNEFIDAMDPHGLFLWVATENEAEELEILTRIEKWS